MFNSGVQVDLEARDFEGRLDVGRTRVGGWPSAPIWVPYSLPSAGLTALHTAILAFNVAMCPPNLCPQGLSTQARDRLACVQMLLHMGADHTSQVSWAVGGLPGSQGHRPCLLFTV